MTSAHCLSRIFVLWHSSLCSPSIVSLKKPMKAHCIRILYTLTVLGVLSFALVFGAGILAESHNDEDSATASQEARRRNMALPAPTNTKTIATAPATIKISTHIGIPDPSAGSATPDNSDGPLWAYASTDSG